MKKKNKRLMLVGGVLLGAAVASGLVLNAFRDSMVFFITPSEILVQTNLPERNFRIGGMVTAGSVQRDPESARVTFLVSDTVASVPVQYEGILPDLFREGQGVVAEGRISSDGVFHAHRVLARHDEGYMPVEATEAIRRAEAARDGDIKPPHTPGRES